MDKRLKKLIKEKTNNIKDKCMLDTYNQKVIKDISCTITTRVNASNEIYIVEIQNGNKIKK